jgi:hypothetical protein
MRTTLKKSNIPVLSALWVMTLLMYHSSSQIRHHHDVIASMRATFIKQTSNGARIPLSSSQSLLCPINLPKTTC